MAKKTTKKKKNPNTKPKTTTKKNIKNRTKPAAKSKGKSKRTSAKQSKTFISKAPIRRLMREEGARLVSDDALAILIKTLEKHAVETTKKAIEIVKDDRRKRITAKDITWATRA
ncbi:MAG: NFYB/HAP3 family transcription factor subunit [Candidatus Lokiarchaeota archaeon]|nr:NFYB/HAP3 family transcription factor subunit [Candidatus Harpocratesius repetitus]